MFVTFKLLNSFISVKCAVLSDYEVIILEKWAKVAWKHVFLFWMQIFRKKIIFYPMIQNLETFKVCAVIRQLNNLCVHDVCLVLQGSWFLVILTKFLKILQIFEKRAFHHMFLDFKTDHERLDNSDQPQILLYRLLKNLWLWCQENRVWSSSQKRTI